MSEVNSYASIYFAYESFLIHTLKVAYNRQSIKANQLSRFFNEPEVKSSLNPVVEQQCWIADASIEKPRLIRDSIAHNGQRPTHQLNNSRYKKDLELTADGKIIIKARDTTALYHVLKDKATLFSKEIVKLPSMTSSQ